MQKIRKYILFIILFTVLGIASEYLYRQGQYDKKDVERFENELHRQEKKVKAELAKILQERHIEELFYEYDHVPDHINYVLYQDSSLQWWTDNSFHALHDELMDITTDTIILLNNSWQYVIPQQQDSIKVIGLIRLKNQFPYENAFLSNHYSKPFDLSQNARLDSSSAQKGERISSASGKTIGFIALSSAKKKNEAVKWLGVLCYILAFMSLLYLMNKLCEYFQKRSAKRTLFLVIGFLVVIKGLLQYFKFPYLFYTSELFSPSLFADSFWLPSLGDLLILSVFQFISIVWVFLYYHQGTKKMKDTVFFFYVLLLVVSTYFFYYCLYTIINSSNISFEAYKVQGLNAFSFVGWFIMLLQGGGLILLYYKLVRYYFNTTAPRHQWVATFVLLTATLALVKISLQISWGNVGLFAVLLFALVYIVKKQLNLFDIPIGSIIILLLTLLVVEDLNRNRLIKEKRAKQLVANNLAYEHDPVAELLLADIDQKILNDTALHRQVFDYSYSIEDVYNYMKKTYFSGYWNKYDLQVTLCSPGDSLQLDNWVHCYSYFDELVATTGVRIDRSKFYFLDVINGRMNYLGQFSFGTGHDQQSMIIELTSKLTTAELGYPELLLRGSQTKQTILDNYSYAKYYNGKLLSQSGDYPYSLSFQPAIEDDTYEYYRKDDYRHLQYRVDNENVIIVSRKAPNVFDHLITFSYVFIFFYLLVLAGYIISRQVTFKSYFRFTLQNKVQFTIISILLVSLVLIGSGSVYFAIKQYREKHYDMLQEKINSVYIELDHKLAMEQTLDESWYSDKYGTLDQLLQKFSDVFYSDINLYYPNGELMASSRKEVFDAGLTGKLMDPHAYKKLVLEQQAIFIHREQIGDLQYLSAYVPFMNMNNELLAYLNLPYFTKENSLRNEVTNLIIALLNVYVILILITIGAAIFVSRQITLPLSVVQRKMKELNLKEKNEPIYYKGEDEIGQLVSEYNRMIMELERSAELLAKSERESAWREMAKQIAHEIKNPLTPMKLSVQHLQRSWKQHENNLDEYLQSFTQSLIEQIENLSAIATAFSNFAKMPVAKKETVDLVNKVHNLVHLFGNNSNVTFDIHIHVEQAIIWADKEQIIRALNNVVKNSLQAIPKDREGKIRIELNRDAGFYVLTISDNGKGIPEDIRDQLFLPNFTTKSGGMGLGLAITKNIIESNGGAIDYTSEEGAGTSFFIRLPVKNKERK